MSILGAILIVVAYLIGSTPSGVIVARLTGGQDPRTVGSGRTGGTNALRAMGRSRAAAVVAGDLLKGAIPVLIARWATSGDVAVEASCAVAAVVGSARSVFLGFHGGRGVGTGVGTMLMIQPLALVISGPIFVGVILATRYVSLGSLAGSASTIPAAMVFFLVLNGSIPLAYLLYFLAGAAVVWIAHADNIHRLVRGNERKFDLGMLSGRTHSGH